MPSEDAETHMAAPRCSKHYQMERQYHDECIGFRVVLAKS
jgi:hypothetical protein